MLNLSRHIKINQDTIKSDNLCDWFDRGDLERIGHWVYECFQRDVESRKGWFQRTEAAMDLAMQIQKDKSFPWQNCSNIAFPLVTIAALQFHSRAYPALINGRSIVQCRVIGEDKEGIEAARADRISKHMSWQLLEQDESWEEQEDRALINVPIVGTAFKKTYFDSSRGHNVSELVLAKDLVLDYWAKSVDSCPTKTHILPMFRNDIHERVRRGIFTDILEESWYEENATVESTQQRDNANNRAGQSTPQANHNTPFILLEQHCWLDLDGDGYAEPYIVTIEQSSQTVLRIVTRFDRIEDIEYDNKKRIIKINAMEYFTKIPFIPSPDGGIMDVGFGVLLGPLNESVNSAINQLFDSGTMANTAGGFLGRGAKIRSGQYSFQPFGWTRVDATGDDLRKAIFPLPVREPSAVMFNLLSLLIDYTNRISGATDMLTGVNPGQNTPAETARSMVEQGQKVYSAVFKRIWRGLKNEFKKLYTLNGIYLPMNYRFGTSGGEVSREDYSGGMASVIPAADPSITSEAARFSQAQLLREAAATNPAYDTDAVERLYLKSLGVDNVDQIYLGMDSVEPTPDVKVQVEQMKLQYKMLELEQKKIQFLMGLQEQQKLNAAKIMQLNAQAFKLMEEGKGESEDKKINAFRAGIEALREDNNRIASQIDFLMKDSSNESGTGSNVGGGTLPGMEAASGNEAANGLAALPAPTIA